MGGLRQRTWGCTLCEDMRHTKHFAIIVLCQDKCSMNQHGQQTSWSVDHYMKSSLASTENGCPALLAALGKPSGEILSVRAAAVLEILATGLTLTAGIFSIK